ncbi:hypothetical protein FDP41_006490 [Naegleria fowleri]|uniref:Uncharacterized protein n=1 Tax=Naegleria fowleri TaxID=5763 RepID=A0A6A5BJZ5_NAEFO|nr:uncharacterized protein FDP41_006490 [Naegleria fowleri]KAF0974458.1 hypothetical protein FDP41_006490 [Naegleria fowleri]CAG4715146.1 unnamed protein product [Naegleria fowleri]
MSQAPLDQDLSSHSKKRKFQEEDDTCRAEPSGSSSSSSTQLSLIHHHHHDNMMDDTKKRKMNSQSRSLMELPPRSSSLSSPILRLEGHQSEVFTCKFSNRGQFMASGAFDKTVLLWDVFGETSDDVVDESDSSHPTTFNYGCLVGHKNAILDLDWLLSEDRLCTASADNSVMLWDSVRCMRVRQFKDHSAVVNCCTTSKHSAQSDLFASGGDDKSINIYDQRERKCVKTIKSKFPIFSVCFSENTDRLFSCGIDHVITTWDMKTDKFLYSLGNGHTDSITDIKLSPDGNFILSNSMDGTCRIWNARHFVDTPNRCVKVFNGAKHSMDKNLTRVSWYKDGSLISTGAENDVIIWNTTSRKIVYQLPGHQGSVNCVHFHPQQPIIASASSDKTIYLGEIDPKAI